MSTGHVAKKRRLSPPAGSINGSVPGFATWNLEQDYERRPRKNQKPVKHEKLLVKTSDGWKENERNIVEEKTVDEADDADSFMASGDEQEAAPVQSEKPRPAKPQLSPKEQILQAKEELARVAGNVSEDPEENVGQLGQLGELAKSDNITVQKLALATQLSVYKDIIPGYRIRPMSKEELQGKLSKDVRKLRGFEQGLLTGFKNYVQMLGALTAPKRKGEDKDAGVSSVAMTCACTLLTAVPHFNCRNELIAIVVRKLSSRRADGDFGKCRDAMEQLFREDEGGHASLEAVSQMSKMMKTRNYQVHEQTLNTFLHLRLLSEFAHKASTNSVDKDEEERPKLKKSQREFRTKKERKRAKERKQVEKEMRDADAEVSHEERDKNQAETLKLVFVAYFRILQARIQHLMGAVLEGLAKYAHLINQDFFGDILEALKDLINDAESLLQPGTQSDNEDEDGDDKDEGEGPVDATTQRNATREALLCVITAFALLHGQQDVAKSAQGLSLDLNFFITHLYRTLVPLGLNPDIELGTKTAHLQDPNQLAVPTAKDNRVNVSTTTVLLLRSLHSILLPPTNVRAVPPVRVAAFVKQLMTLALQVPQKSTTALLGLLQQVTKTHASKVAALWNTEERKGDGVFDALSHEVESSNPFAASVWEGELLRLHFDPTVRDAVKAIEKSVIVQTR